jgi:hypothetical protein
MFYSSFVSSTRNHLLKDSASKGEGHRGQEVGQKHYSSVQTLKSEVYKIKRIHSLIYL